MAREPWPRRPAPYDRPMNRRLWIWRHFRFWLPEDWEMLQFTRHSAVGRCAFADRYAFRLEINWRAVAGPPDFELMLRNYVARLREEGHERLRPIRRAGWRGVASQKNDLACSRFGAYFDAESCLVEMVFLWPGIPTAPELEKEILESVAESPPDAAGRRRWLAFGLDLRVHDDLRPTRCQVDPGAVDWHFADARGRRWTRFRRIGLRPLWMRQTVDEWMRAGAPPLRAARAEMIERDGHVIRRWGGRLSSGWLQRLIRGPYDYQAEAWICPADDRLYVREIRGPASFVQDESRGGGLRCAVCEGACS